MRRFFFVAKEKGERTLREAIAVRTPACLQEYRSFSMSTVSFKQSAEEEEEEEVEEEEAGEDFSRGERGSSSNKAGLATEISCLRINV